MELKDVILKCHEYGEDDELIYQVFAKRIEGKFEAKSEAVVLSLTEDEAELNIGEIAKSKCPGYDYFLELFIIQEFMDDLKSSKDFQSDESKVDRVIHYAMFDS